LSKSIEHVNNHKSWKERGMCYIRFMRYTILR
jgi:hypothetical protein